MATADLSPLSGRIVRTPDGREFRVPPGATSEQVDRFLGSLSGKPAPVAPAPSPSFENVTGGSSVAPAPASAPINPFTEQHDRRRAVAEARSGGNPIVRGFTGTIYGGNVAAAGGTLEAVGASTGIRPLAAAGRAVRQHGERFSGPPPPPDIFQIAPDDPAGRQKVMDYLGFSLGSGMASSAPSVAGSLVGGALTRTTAGAVAGAAVPAYLLNTGGVYQEIEKIGGRTPAGRARIALVIGLPVTALDVISPIKFAGKLSRFMLREAVKAPARKLAARVGIGTARGAAIEGGTESGQRLLEMVGVEQSSGRDFTWGEVGQETAGAAIGGAMTGGVLGGGTSIPQRRGPGPVPEPPPPVGRQSPAQRRAAAIARATEAAGAPSITPTLPFEPTRAPTPPVRAAAPAPTPETAPTPEPAQAVTPATPAGPRRGVSEDDAAKLSHEDLERLADEEASYEKGTEVRLFGEEGARRYAGLQRRANSNTATREASDAASAEIERMEAALTESQRSELFGIGQTGMNAEDMGRLRRVSSDYHPGGLSEASDAEIESDLARALLISHPFGKAATRLRLLRLAAEASRRGWDHARMMEAVSGFARSRGIEPDDARVLLAATMREIGPAEPKPPRVFPPAPAPKSAPVPPVAARGEAPAVPEGRGEGAAQLVDEAEALRDSPSLKPKPGLKGDDAKAEIRRVSEARSDLVEKRTRAYVAAAGEAGVVEFAGYGPHETDRLYVLHRNVDRQDREHPWRITRVRPDGPVGHNVFKTREAALRDLAEDGVITGRTAPGRMDEWSKTNEWSEGVDKLLAVSQENRARLDPGGIGKQGVEHPPMDDVMIADAAASSGASKKLAALAKSGASDDEIRAALVESFGLGGGSASGKTSYTYAVESGQPVIKIPGYRGLRADRVIAGADLVAQIRRGLEIPQKPEAEPAAAPERKFKKGDRVSVPYIGRSKKLRSQKAEVIGYVEHSDGRESVLVHVKVGTKYVQREVPERHVRRRPDMSPEAVRARVAKKRAASERRLAKLGENANRAMDLLDRFDDDIDQIESQIVEIAAASARPGRIDPQDRREYDRLRRRLRAMLVGRDDLLDVIRASDPDFVHDPQERAGRGDLPGDEDVGSEGPNPWDDERGFIRPLPPDLAPVLDKALRRLSGIIRRDPAVKEAFALSKRMGFSPKVSFVVRGRPGAP